MKWQPSLGAWLEKEGTRFRVWAPEAGRLELVLQEPSGGPRELALEPARLSHARILLREAPHDEGGARTIAAREKQFLGAREAVRAIACPR